MFVLVIGGLIAVCTGLFLANYYNIYKAFPTADEFFTHNSFKFQYESHCDQGWREAPSTSQLDFNSFLHLMQVNPDRWEWNSGSMRLYYRHREDDHIQVIFSKKDFLKFRKWLFQQSVVTGNLEKHKADTDNCQIILETAQKDIDHIRELARAQIKEARELMNSVAARHLEDDIELVPITHVENEVIRQEYKTVFNPGQKVKGYYADGHGRQWAFGENGEVMYEIVG